MPQSKTATITESFKCSQCGKQETLTLPFEAYRRWKDGQLIQRCFPELNDDQREIMISGICGKCFDPMFADRDDADEADELEHDFEVNEDGGEPW